jgi:long-chain acyl-CoA synthetase
MMVENDNILKPDTTHATASKNCKELISYLSTVSSKEVNLNSHIELDLGLDSLNYVELFLYIENSFGVKIDETIFADLMIVEDLCKYILKNKLFDKDSDIKLSDLLNEPIDKKLIYSPIAMFFWKYILYPVFKIYFRLELKGEQNILKTPCIFAPSHQSMLDGFLVLSTLPYSVLKKTFFLSYKNTFGNSILKPIAVNGQNILIDSNDHLKDTLKYSALSIRDKSNIVIFPEGARSRNRKLLKFKPFFAILSKTFNVPVVPVVVDGGFEALRSGRYFPKPKKVKVTYLEAIYPDSLSVEEIVDKTKTAIDTQMKKDPINL